MLWEDATTPDTFVVPREVVDLVFRIDCRELPVDHAWLLYESIRRVLPWIDEDHRVAIHSIHGAASGNGWMRPSPESGQHLQLPRRTRLSLRMPAARAEAARVLTGKVLQLGEHRMWVGECQLKALVPTDTLFARSVRSDSVDDEEHFTHWMAHTLRQRGIRLRKMLCGVQHLIHCPEGHVAARSVMLSGLEFPEAIRLQEQGIGDGYTLGCGIFLPHKSVTAVQRQPLTV